MSRLMAAAFPGVTPEPSNAELRADIAALRASLDAYLTEHRHDHASLENRLALHDTSAALRDRSITDLQRLVPSVDGLHDFEVQVRTLGSLIRFATGGSLIAAAVGIISLVLTLQHLAGG